MIARYRNSRNESRQHMHRKNYRSERVSDEATINEYSMFTRELQIRLRLIPTRHSSGFRRKPSRVSSGLSGSARTKWYRRKMEDIIISNSIEARLRPTHALGPYENGLKAFCMARWSRSNHRSGRNLSASSPHACVSRWMVYVGMLRTVP